ETLLQVLRGLGAVAQRARQVRADRQLVAADRLRVEQRVEARHLVDRDRRQAEVACDVLDRLPRYPADLVLRDRERRDRRRALVLGRIFRELAIDARVGLVAEQSSGLGNGVHVRGGPVSARAGQRSISPKTMSSVPIIVVTSLSMWPRTSSSIAARCAKPAARLFIRCGLFAPSEIK